MKNVFTLIYWWFRKRIDKKKILKTYFAMQTCWSEQIWGEFRPWIRKKNSTGAPFDGANINDYNVNLSILDRHQRRLTLFEQQTNIIKIGEDIIGSDWELIKEKMCCINLKNLKLVELVTFFKSY